MKLSPIKIAYPLHKAIYDHLLDSIRNGLFAPGEKLPSEFDLARELNVSRTSLREALRQLELEGYIVRKRGVGTFVIGPRPFSVDAGIEKLHSVTQIIRARGFTPGTAECIVTSEPADQTTAKRLDIPVGEIVSVVRRVRTADNLPFCYDVSRFPARFLAPTIDPALLGESLFKYVEGQLGLYISHAITYLIPVQSDKFLSSKLAIPEGSSLLCLDQVHFLQDNTPVWYAQVYFPRQVLIWHVVRTR